LLGFAETFGATVASFVLPAIVALVIISVVARFLKARYLAAFAIGIYFWFFSDTIGDANLLGANEGFAGGFFHIALWIAFAVGLVLVISIDRDLFTPGPEGVRFGFAIPLLVALAIGIHGFGEGAAIGATAVTTPAGNLIDAFGGFSAAVAFVVHKVLEPMIVGAAYWIYAKDHAKDMAGRVRDVVLLVLVFTIPGIIGAGSAYYVVQTFPGVDFTYVFALGLGTSIYAAVRLARALFEGGATSRYESTKVAILILLGFTCLYLAAMLHS
jgi:zinc transporter ZupT